MAVISLEHPFVKHRLGQLRARPANPIFRNNVRDLCRCLAYEATRNFELKDVYVDGFAGNIKVQEFKHKSPSAVPILRAGFGMLDGFLDVFPDAPISTVGIFRNEETLEPVSYYNSLVPDIHERVAFILDPMLATGGSLIATIELLKKANCQTIYGLFLVASAQGVEKIQKIYPDVHIYACSIDAELNDKGYIVPGLGDAGDLIFGTY